MSEDFHVINDASKWTPTAQNINALPRRIREYIHDIETRCGDPAMVIQENAILKENLAALEKRLAMLRDTIQVDESFLREIMVTAQKRLEADL